MKNFEERYQEYLAKNRNVIAYNLWEEQIDLECNFDSNFRTGGFCGRILFPVLICGGISVRSIIYTNKILLSVICSVLWIISMVLCVHFSYKTKTEAKDFFFFKYHRNKVIEERVKRDEEHELSCLFEEMNND